jgi:N-acetylglucosamine kinase-like BadF-type ATPase
MTDFVLAIDGGNVKTDLALLRSDGRLLSLVRGGRSSPHYLGVAGCVEVLQTLLAEAALGAGLRNGEVRVATAQVMLAGADLPEELDELYTAIDALRWTERLVVDNDTYALLRSGTDRGWGVAVVFGGGENCVGLAPDGRQVRFPSLGPISGDWGGGYDVGMAALMAAARSADGRGARSSLEGAVPAHFGLAEPFDVARALHLGEIPLDRLGELARVVFGLADEDQVASAIVGRLGDEVIAFACATLRRLELTGEAPDVVLGGGLLRNVPASAIERIDRGIREVTPRANVVVASTAPIVGAALLGLDELGVGSAASARARRELHEAFVRVEGDSTRASDGQTIAVGQGGHLLVRNLRG